MGIKGLSQFLKTKYPDLFVETHLSEYAYKKVAIDVSLYMCKYKVIFGDSWLTSFINLVSCLRRNNVHCVFIYDGKAPIEKDKEKKKRSERKDKIKEKIAILENSLDNYYKTQEIDDVIKSVYNAEKGKTTRLLNNKERIDIRLVERVLSKWKSQNINFSPDDILKTKEVFDILKIPYISSETEAETLCSQLCVKGCVDAVISEDTDVLVYGTPKFLTKINTLEDTCIEISYDKMLESMEFTPSQFKDFCILCGTDYNENIPKVGPVKAYNLIKDHGCIEKLEELGYDIECLNFVRGREIFNPYTDVDYTVPYCGIADIKELENFVILNNCKINMEKVKNSLINTPIIFEDTENEVVENEVVENEVVENEVVENEVVENEVV